MIFGTQNQGLILMRYKEDSIQYCSGYYDNWWKEDEENIKPTLKRGRLIWAFLPHTFQVPYKLDIVDRTNDPTNHNKAFYEMSSLNVSYNPAKANLPSAAINLHQGEILIANKAKKRPAIVISTGGDKIDKKLTLGVAKYQISSTILVVPSYGIKRKIGGEKFSTEFKKRIRQGLYPQYILENLPISSNDRESYIRLDHIQPIGKHHQSIELTPYYLTEEALNILDEWIDWLFYGTLDPKSELYLIKELIDEELIKKTLI